MYINQTTWIVLLTSIRFTAINNISTLLRIIIATTRIAYNKHITVYKSYNTLLLVL